MQLGGGEGNRGSSSGIGASYRTLRSRRDSQVLGEINVTPFVDVVLVLLLVFMVTAPMMSRGIDVNLPVATITETLPEDRLTISIKADGHIYISDKPINPALLEDTLKSMVAAGHSAKVAYLRADERLAYGKVVEVIDTIKRAGIETIGLAYSLPQEKDKRR